MRIPAPVIQTPVDGATVQPRSIITGSGSPGARITINQADYGSEWGAGTVKPDGQWEILLEIFAQPGEFYRLTARQFASDGASSDWATNISFMVADPTAQVHVTAPPVILNPTQGDQQTPPCPVVSGTGTPGAKVILYQSGVGTQWGNPAEVDSNGRWSITLNEASVAGQQYGVTAKQSGTDGSQSSWAENVYFTVQTTSVPSKHNPMGIDPCDSQNDPIFNATKQKRNGVDPRTGLFKACVPLPPICGNYGKGPVVDMSLFYTPVVNNSGALGDGWFFSFTFYNKTNNKLTLHSGESITIQANQNSEHPSVEVHWLGDETLLVQRRDDREEILRKLPGTEIYAPEKIITDKKNRLNLTWEVVPYTLKSITYHQVRLTQISDPQRVLLNVQYQDGFNSSAFLDYWPDDQSERLKYNLEIIDYALQSVIAPDGTKSTFDYFDHQNCGWLLKTINTFEGAKEEVLYLDNGLIFKDNPKLSTLPSVSQHIFTPRGGIQSVKTCYSYEWTDPENYSTKITQGSNDIRSTTYNYNKNHEVSKETISQGSSTTVKTYKNQPLYSVDGGFECVAITQYQKNGKSYQTSMHNVFDKFGMPANLQNGVLTLSLGVNNSLYHITNFLADSYIEYGSTLFEAANLRRVLYPDAPKQTNLINRAAFETSKYHYYNEYLHLESDAYEFEKNSYFKFYSYDDLGIPKPSSIVSLTNSAKSLKDAAINVTKITYNKTDEHYGRQSTIRFGFMEKGGKKYHDTFTSLFHYTTNDTQLTTTTIQSAEYGELQYTSTKTHSVLSGRLIRQTDENGNIAELTYNQYGQLDTYTTCAQSPTYKQTTHYAYPSAGRIEITESNGRQRASEYDGRDNLILEYTRDNEYSTWRQVLSVSYDDLGRKLRTTHYDYLDDGTQLREWEECLYDDWNEECGRRYSSGLQTFNQFDPIARTRTEWSGTAADLHGKVTTYNGDQTVSKIEWKDVNGNVYQTQVFSYTHAGQVERQVTTGEFGVVTLDHTYDGMGRLLTEQRTEQSTGLNYTYYYTYPLNWMISESEKVEIEFDGRRRTLGQRTFDNMGRVISLTRGTVTDTYTYNSSSVPSTKRTAEGNTLSYEYIKELGNRLSRVCNTTGSEEKRFTYAFGNQNTSTASEGDSLLTFNHDINALVTCQRAQAGNSVKEAKSNYSTGGRLLTTTDPLNTGGQYSYTSTGQRNRSSDSNVETIHSYDALGRLDIEIIQHPTTKTQTVVNYTYDTQHRETSRIFTIDNSLNLELTRSYYANGSLKASELRQNNNVLGSRALTYNEAGRLTSCTTSGVWRSKSLNNNFIAKQVFTYDALGNVRTCVTTEDGNSTPRTSIYTYDDASGCQLASVEHLPTDSAYPASATLSYDAAGRVTRDHRGKTYSYDWLGRLTQAGSTYYNYDAQDRLIISRKGNKTRQVFYSGTEVTGDYSQGEWQDSDSRHLCPGSSACTVMRLRYSGQDKRELFELRDVEGTVLISYDIQAQTLKHHAYSAYGDHFSDETESLLGFNGEYRDTDNDQYPLGQGYRWYAPDSLQFHTQDSLSPFDEGGPQPYGYCDGDPVNIQDPTGHIGSGAVNKSLRGIWGDSLPGPLKIGVPKHSALISTILWTGIGVLTAIMSGGTSLLVTGALVALAVASSATAIASVLLDDTHPELATYLGWASLGFASAGGVVSLLKKTARLALYLARSGRAVARELSRKTMDALTPTLRRFGLFKGHLKIYGRFAPQPSLRMVEPFPFSPANLIKASGATALFDFDDAITIACVTTGVLGNSKAFDSDDAVLINNNVNNATNVGWKMIRLGKHASNIFGGRT